MRKVLLAALGLFVSACSNKNQSDCPAPCPDSTSVAATEYALNTQMIKTRSGGVPFSQFSYLPTQVTGSTTSVDVEVETNNSTVEVDQQGCVSAVGIAIVQDGKLLGYADPQKNGLSTVSFPLAGTGNRRIDFYNGIVQRPNDAGDTLFCRVRSLTFRGTKVEAKQVSVPLHTARVIAATHSIGGGIQSPHPVLDGYLGQLKKLDPKVDFLSDGYGWATASRRFATLALRTASINRWKQAWTGASKPILLLDFGVNDAYNALSYSSPAQVGAVLHAVIVETKQQVPTLQVLVVTPIGRAYEGANAHGEKFSEYRNALEGLRTGLESYVVVVPGLDLLPYSKAVSFDGTHPNATGYKQIADGLHLFLLQML